MGVYDRIPSMPDASLMQLEENARRNPARKGAQEILDRIGAEWADRWQRAAEEKAKADLRIAEQVRDLPLAERIEIAFREMPPSEAQIRRLLILIDHPGLDQDDLARLAGDKGPGGFNFALGGMCIERRHYLPEPPTLEYHASEPFWGGLLCVLEPRVGPTGRRTLNWRLRPEAVLALRRLGYLPA